MLHPEASSHDSPIFEASKLSAEHLPAARIALIFCARDVIPISFLKNKYSKHS